MRTQRAAKKAEEDRKNAEQRAQVVAQLKTDGVKDGRIDAVAGSGAISELGGGIEGPNEKGAA